MKPKEIDKDKLHAIINERKQQKWGLIPLLQAIQEEFGYVPPMAIEPISAALNICSATVQGVITFYSGFSLTPKGKYVLRVCRGTACHVKGGQSILSMVKKDLGLGEGETSEDYQFTLETVACLGACFVAPAMMVNKTYYGKLSPNKVNNVIGQYKKAQADAREKAGGDE